MIKEDIKNKINIKSRRSKENYLRLIHNFHGTNGARSIDIANNLNISKASVSEMLRKLAKQNLVRIQPYSKIILTEKGRKHAEKLADNHLIIKKFVEKFFEHDEQLVKQEAHELEHALSDESIKIIDKIMKLGIHKQKLNVPCYVG